MVFDFLDKDMMRSIITKIIRPKLECAEVIYRSKNHVLKLERIQRIATKMVPNWKTYHIKKD